MGIRRRNIDPASSLRHLPVFARCTQPVDADAIAGGEGVVIGQAYTTVAVDALYPLRLGAVHPIMNHALTLLSRDNAGLNLVGRLQVEGFDHRGNPAKEIVTFDHAGTATQELSAVTTHAWSLITGVRRLSGSNVTAADVLSIGMVFDPTHSYVSTPFTVALAHTNIRLGVPIEIHEDPANPGSPIERVRLVDIVSGDPRAISNFDFGAMTCEPDFSALASRRDHMWVCDPVSPYL